MMSQNRQGQGDRLAAAHEYRINNRAEEDIAAILGHLEDQDARFLPILRRMEEAGPTGGGR